ncbi:hypothetical protein AB4472_09495 [Vibrio lentus]
MTTSNQTLKFLEHHNQLTDAVACNVGLSRGVRTLMVGISTFYNLNKQCAFPSRKQIAERTGFCVNHITDLIKEAVELGALKSTAQFVQYEDEKAPRQTTNKYEFNLAFFGLCYSKAKSMLNRNLSKKRKENKATQQAASSRVEHINQMIDEAYPTNQSDDDTPDWEGYSPPD